MHCYFEGFLCDPTHSWERFVGCCCFCRQRKSIHEICSVDLCLHSLSGWLLTVALAYARCSVNWGRKRECTHAGITKRNIYLGNLHNRIGHSSISRICNADQPVHIDLQPRFIYVKHLIDYYWLIGNWFVVGWRIKSSNLTGWVVKGKPKNRSLLFQMSKCGSIVSLKVNHCKWRYISFFGISTHKNELIVEKHKFKCNGQIQAKKKIILRHR